MIKRVLKIFVFLIVLFSILLNTTCSLATEVTEEDLNQAFVDLFSSSYTEEEYSFFMSNNIITLTLADETYYLNYDLTGNPKFSYEVNVENGMTYDEFQEKTQGLDVVFFGYAAVAKTQGIDFDASSTYIGTSLLFGGLANADLENQYMIVDDDTTVENSEGVTIIKKSEFGEHVLEYAKYLCGQDIVYSDVGKYNTYTWATTIEDETDSSCKIVSTIEVNLDGDFEGVQEFGNAFKSNITEENADYVIKLKIGQECQIVTDSEIRGHGFVGSSVEISEDHKKFTAIKKGTTTGHLYFGDDEISKSFYISVEENETGETLSPIVLKIYLNSENDPIFEVGDNTVAPTILPKTGKIKDMLIVISFIVFICFTILFTIEKKRFKDL